MVRKNYRTGPPGIVQLIRKKFAFLLFERILRKFIVLIGNGPYASSETKAIFEAKFCIL